jgi:hypothetical protein
MKNLNINLETIIKVVVITFIAFTLISVVIAIFKDTTILNRSF